MTPKQRRLQEPYRKKRGVAQQFECLHVGKYSLCLDGKDPRDYEELLRQTKPTDCPCDSVFARLVRGADGELAMRAGREP